MLTAASTQEFGVISSYARRVHQAGPGNLETFILQNRAYSALEVLAQASHPSSPSLARLLQTLRFAASPSSTEGAKDFARACEPRVLLSIAKILANRDLEISDAYTAVAIYKLVLAATHKRIFKEQDRLVFVEALAALGFAFDVRKYSQILGVRGRHAENYALLQANCKNPFLEGAEPPIESRAVEAWLTEANVPFISHGYEPISLVPGTDDPFDRVICSSMTEVKEGPLVTVVVPTFNADQRFDTMMRSLLSQSWQNLQIVVVDDHTPGGLPEQVEKWTEVDERVTVIHMPTNGGTYRNRNFVLDEIAEGDFFTVHDDDDWSHPRKIETQVRDLETSDDIANMSMMSRATGQMEFVRINNNADRVQRNFSSLMFRTEEMKRRFGFWDEVNRSGDAELVDRIQRDMGRQVRGVGDAPLSFQRVRTASLTSGEIGRGYIDPRRRWYQMSSRSWQEQTPTGGDPTALRLERGHAAKGRRFRAPSGMLLRPGERAADVDIVYATDARFPGGNSSATATEISTLLEAGMTVALLQIDSPLNGPRSVINPALQAVTDRDGCTVISRLDKIDCGAVIIRHPSVLQFAPAERAPINVRGTVAIIANHAAVEPDGGGMVYDPSDAADTAEALFGVKPVIFGETEITRRTLRGLVDPRLISRTTWAPTVSMADSAGSHSVSPKRKPVIGRHGRDHTLKWPGHRSAITDAYPVDESVEVRILGGANEASRIAGRDVTSSWAILEYGEQEVPDFLSGLDFWVYMHSDRLRESFGMAAAEAMAAGVVTILPPYMKSTFGDGAVYCTVPNVRETVQRYWSDPELYEKQSCLGAQFIRDNFGSEALLDRVEELLG